MEAKQVVQNGKMTTVTLTAGYFSEIGEIEYMRVSVKTVMGSDETFTLHIADISMDSREHDTDELRTLIHTHLHRDPAQDSSADELRQRRGSMLLFTAGATLLCTVVIALMMTHHQKTKDESEDQS